MSKMMHERSGSIWRKVTGWACLVLGVLGIVLPIIPGIPFLIAGVATLSTQHRWARTSVLWIKRRFRNLRSRNFYGRAIASGVPGSIGSRSPAVGG